MTLRLGPLYGRRRTVLVLSSRIRLTGGLRISNIRLKGGSVPVSRTERVLKRTFVVNNATGAFRSILLRCHTKTSCLNVNPFHFAAAGRGLDPILNLRNCISVLTRVRRTRVRLPMMTVKKVACRSVPTVLHAKIGNVTLSKAVLQTGSPMRRAEEVLGGGWFVKCKGIDGYKA